MKKDLIGIIICVLLISSALPVTANVLVDKSPILIVSGKTLYVGGIGPENYSRIQDAIDNAFDGDTVFVYDDSSPYNENINLYKSINLIGEKKETTIIDGGGSGDVLNISANDVTISDFTIQNSGDKQSDSGIKIHFRYINISINNNNIFYNTWGIQFSRSWDDFVEGNDICYNEIGIWIHHSSVTISDNNISDNLHRGIYLLGDENVIINNIISGNLFNRYADTGIELEGENNIISGNIISEFNSAININTANDNQIISNNISYNKLYINLFRSNRNLISRNNFINNDDRGKNFINSFYNKWENNYWDRKRIFPYFIFGEIWLENLGDIFIRWFNIDWNPASEPYTIEI